MADRTLSRVLIIQTAFLGDTVLATGILEKIHQHYSEACLDILVRKGNESLFENHPFLNEVLVFDKKNSKYQHLIKLLWKINRVKYDLVINIQRYFTTGIITVLANSTISVGFNKNPLSILFSKRVKHEFSGLHEIERNHKLVEWFTDNQPSRPRLYPSEKNIKNISSFLKDKFLTISPASVWATKQYPKEKWVEVIDTGPHNITIYLLGGPGDHELCEWIRENASNQQVVNLSGNLSLLDTAALMSRSALNLMNDSAPMHISSAVNAPTCAIYCSTVPAFGYGPLADNSDIVEIRDNLYCRPCGIHGHRKCPENHFRCAWEINPDEINARINNAISMK